MASLRPVEGGRESSSCASALTFPVGEETSASLMAHVMRLFSLILIQEMGVCKTCSEENKPSMR